ncbi:chromate resistance protein [Candidatus Beckwithbacteria bacterium]|nr:chromate resistance protein [Candidatus Beckwithbacteria bacterium]
MSDKLIITHTNPDPDAICSVWLLRRFDQEMIEAGVAFVSAGKTYQDQTADSDPDVIHVDTGMGQFDHHQTGERTCAALLVLEQLKIKYDYLQEDEALDRLVQVILADDHFDECCWPEASADRYQFMFGEILDGLKHNNTLTDQGLIDFGSTCLDGIYTMMKLKVDAENEINSQGREFQSQWGKALAIVSKNDEVLPIAQKLGYVLVVRKDPDGMVRIKANPSSEVDLAQACQKAKELDPEATWFLHASKKMLLNGSYKNPDSKFSKLRIEELIGLFNH